MSNITKKRIDQRVEGGRLDTASGYTMKASPAPANTPTLPDYIIVGVSPAIANTPTLLDKIIMGVSPAPPNTPTLPGNIITGISPAHANTPTLPDYIIIGVLYSSLELVFFFGALLFKKNVS